MVAVPPAGASCHSSRRLHGSHHLAAIPRENATGSRIKSLRPSCSWVMACLPRSRTVLKKNGISLCVIICMRFWASFARLAGKSTGIEGPSGSQPGATSRLGIAVLLRGRAELRFPLVELVQVRDSVGESYDIGAGLVYGSEPERGCGRFG